jgi:hypothetical protein
VDFFGVAARAEIRLFAEDLAKGLRKDVPRTLVDGPVISINRVSVVLERTYAKAVTFRNEKAFGFWGRSIFANAFRWKLIEIGYPEAFAKVATEGLVFAFSGVAGRKGGVS